MLCAMCMDKHTHYELRDSVHQMCLLHKIWLVIWNTLSDWLIHLLTHQYALSLRVLPACIESEVTALLSGRQRSALSLVGFACSHTTQEDSDEYEENDNSNEDHDGYEPDRGVPGYLRYGGCASINFRRWRENIYIILAMAKCLA